jgi:hypothetical protein
MMMEMMKELISMLKSQNGEGSKGRGCHEASGASGHPGRIHGRHGESGFGAIDRELGGNAAGQPIDIKGGSGDDTIIVCNSSDHARTH